MDNNGLSIVDFYAGKSIFLTGGTGFLGKVIIEKLLYECKDIENIYLLIRNIKDKTLDQRFEDIIETPVFDRIKKSHPEVLNKIIPISGDISEPNLGIKRDDEQYFLDKVSVVFHSAASIRFNEPLPLASNLNYEATKRVLKLCQRMNNLKSLVYISTAYINPQKTTLAEVPYPSPLSEPRLYRAIESKEYDDEGKLEQLLQGRPNVYTLTKAMADAYVAENHGSIPTAIVRPSVVCTAHTDPFPGWIDGWSAATAFIATTFLGYSHIARGHKNNAVDFVPVDYATNLCIAAAVKSSSSKNLEIYNGCTSISNPLTLKELFSNTKKISMQNKYNKSPIYVFVVNNKMFEMVASLFLEKIPSYLGDAWLGIRGKKLRYMRIQSRVAQQRALVNYFTSQSWRMRSDRTEALSNQLTRTEQEKFKFNPKTIHWPQYLQSYCYGVTKFLLKK